MAESEVNRVQIKELKEGKLVVIDGEPCKIVSYQKSKPGKHGSAKARIDAVSLFTGSKKGLMGPVDSDCEVPVLIRKGGQMIADLGKGKVQIMDLQSFETFEMDIPAEEQGKIESGKEIEYHEVMGKRLFIRVK